MPALWVNTAGKIKEEKTASIFDTGLIIKT
jgi:hypothetical protein